MKKVLLSLITVFTIMSSAKAGVGLQFGFGLPYVSQLGIDVTLGPQFTLSASRNGLSLDDGEASVALSMQEVGIKWHPFSGAFFLGIGAGSQSLEVEATDATTNASAAVDVSTAVTVAKIGWMWGKQDGGIWFGIDLSAISPSGGDIEITGSGFTEADQEYQDVKDAAEIFAETSYTNVTIFRLGYIF